MKLFSNQLIYLFAATVFIFSSCSDDEDPSRRDLLIGTWEIQTGELVDYEVILEGASLNRSTVQGLAAINSNIAAMDQAIENGTDILFPAGTLISFNDDNSFTLDEPNEVTTGTWSLSDDEETVSVQAANDLGISQLDFSIRSLTEQTVDVALQIEDSDVNLENFDLDDLPVNIDGFTIDYSFSFQKQ